MQRMMQAEIHIFGGPVLVFSIDTETAVHSTRKKLLWCLSHG